MPDHAIDTQEVQPEGTERFRFPFLHFVIGLILSFIGFFILVGFWGFIVSLFSSNGTSSYPNKTSAVFVAYLIPEVIIIGLLIWFAVLDHRAGRRGFMWSYIMIAIISFIFLSFICLVMGSVGC